MAQFYMGLFVSLVCIVSFTRHIKAVKKQSKPNFLFILVDDLGFNDIGYHAKYYRSAIKTPHLDELASKGIKLENYYVHPKCTPTRGALLTGKYDVHIGLQHKVIRMTSPHGLPLDNELLPQRLQKCGYDTHMVGKWHLGHSKTSYLPWKRGFNTFAGMLGGEQNYFTRNRCYHGICGFDWWTHLGPSNKTFGKYSLNLYSEKAIEAISKRDLKKPFFLYLSYQAPHRPLQVPASYARRFRFIRNARRRRYAGMIAALDESVKKVTDFLKKEKLFDDTILVFSTDNGGETTEGGNNWPLRGRKGTLWEGGVKAVGFVYGERLKKHGTTFNDLFHVTDWLPTFLSAAGCKENTKKLDNLDGFDQWIALTRNTRSPRASVLHTIDSRWRKIGAGNNSQIFNPSTRAAIRLGPWKLITGDAGFSGHVPPPEALMRAPFLQAGGGLKLFHVGRDPREFHDVVHLYPNIVDGLLRYLAYYESTTVPALYRDSSRKANSSTLGGFWEPWLDEHIN